MTVLSCQSIIKRSLEQGLISPFHYRSSSHGMSFGCGPASYDIRVAERFQLRKGEFRLASSMERFNMPNDLIARVCDKSTWARRGLVVQNTRIEPGWAGYLTLELTNHGIDTLWIEPGMPIAAIEFELLDEPTDSPYAGKYQNAPAGPQPAILEEPCP